MLVTKGFSNGTFSASSLVVAGFSIKEIKALVGKFVVKTSILNLMVSSTIIKNYMNTNTDIR